MRLQTSPSASIRGSTTTPTIICPAQKRSRQLSPSPLLAPALILAEPEAAATTGSVSEASPLPASGTSSFRNVSACHRCRKRKHKCDLRLPACSACKKAGENCVGYDPITKRDIPRRYAAALCTFLIPFF